MRLAESGPTRSEHTPAGRPARGYRGPAARRGGPRRAPLVAEIVALVALALVDTVLLLRFPGRAGTGGGLDLAVGPAVAVTAVLRRRFTGRVGLLGGAVAGLSLLVTASHGLAEVAGLTVRAQPSAAESLAIALLVAAGCRYLRRWPAVALAVAGGLAVTSAPVVRYGIDSPAALSAVPGALLWGTALAFGLVLRDADARRLAGLAEVRTGERLRLARELHDLVAHHVTGIVVRAQAARLLAETGPGGADDAEVFAQIEQSGADALAAMRSLVGMLRSGGPAAGRSADLHAVVRDAVGGDSRVAVRLPAESADVPLSPEMFITVHRTVLEALTNVRRHAPDATETVVEVWVEPSASGDDLRVDVVNDGVTDPERGERRGYGLVGMAERAETLGGAVRSGPEPGGRWRVSVRLPLAPPDGGAGQRGEVY